MNLAREAKLLLCLLILGCVAVGLVALTPLVQADDTDADISFVIERRDDGVELYLGGRADLVVDAFQADIPGLLTGEGHVPFNRFSSGTWTLGEHLMAPATFAVGGKEQNLLAMSLMMHPAWQPIVFRDAVDAVLAVSICAVQDAPTDLTLSQSTLYAGYISYVDYPHAPLSISLPIGSTTNNAELTVSVRDHTDGTLTAAYTLVWSADEPLVFKRTGPAMADGGDAIERPGLLSLPSLTFGFALLGAALVGGRRLFVGRDSSTA